MKRTTHSTRVINGNGPGKDAFGDGVPGSVAATVLDSSVANAWQEEIAAIIERAGLTLNAANNHQAYDAIAQMISLATGGAVSNAAYTNVENLWTAKQEFSATDATIPFLITRKTAADGGTSWKQLATFNMGTAGWCKFYVSAQSFAITINAFWETANGGQWRKDVTSGQSFACFLSANSGRMRLSVMPASTSAWTTWSDVLGDAAVGGYWNYASAKTRTSVIGTGTMSNGDHSGGDGSLAANLRSYGWSDLHFPDNWTGGVIEARVYQASTTPAKINLAERTIDWSNASAAPTMAFTKTATGPTSSGWQTLTLDLSAVTFDGNKEYRLQWEPGSNTDQFGGYRIRDWKDNGPRNFL